MTASRGDTIMRALLYTGAVLLIALSVGPTLWLLFGAFSPATDDLGGIPSRLTLENVRQIWNDDGLQDALLNSVVVTFGRAALNVL
ncbi:MAG: hypothetical protein AAFR76_03345, partial [Planctomycetota bacterium]